MKAVPATPVWSRQRALIAVKLLHTAAWAFFVVCILAIPVAGACRRFDIGLVSIVLVLIECLVLSLNRGRCPLTAIAARYTDDRSPSFDIYLPVWVAARNKAIFGSLFVLNCVILFCEWLTATGWPAK